MADGVVSQPMDGESRLKGSAYNYFLPFSSDTFVGYNFLYRSIIRFPSKLKTAIDDVLRNGIIVGDRSMPLDLPPQWIVALQQANFLINQEVDEIAVLKFRYNQSLFANDTLSLVVLPTLWCNFRCPYCFEFKKPAYMDPSTQDALVQWIEKAFRDKRHVRVAWFGGEPLLAKDTIRSLTRRLQAFSEKIKADYHASMTTNGFYLDKAFRGELPSLGIRHVQVTLDGDQPDHDLLRMQNNGQGSFERVFANIMSFSEIDDGSRLTIRVNCADANYDGIPRLLKRFPADVTKKASIFFRWVWSNKASGNKEFSEQRRGENAYNGLAELYEVASRAGWQIDNPHLATSSSYCEVDYLDHFTVSADGSIYLCTHTFDPQEAIGSLRSGDQPLRDKAVALYAKWYALGPFDDPECVSCQLLPVCMGGCRKSRLLGFRECIEEKMSVDRFVRNTVEDRIQVRLSRGETCRQMNQGR